MDGKEKCKALKQIRKQIAENNDIKYVVEECKHKGKCKGTCPKCEAEVRYLERELEKRRSLGKKVAIAGVSLSIAATFSACSPQGIVSSVTDSIVDLFDGNNYNNNLQGAAQPYYPPEELGGDAEYIPEIDPGTDIDYGLESNNGSGEDCGNGDCDNTGNENGPDDLGILTPTVTDGELAPDELDYEIAGSIEYMPAGDEDYNSVTIIENE